MTEEKAVKAPKSVKGAEDATRKRPEEVNSDGVDTYTDPESFKSGTREQYLQAQAENLRASKGVGSDGELAVITAREFGQVDTESHPDNESRVLYGPGATHAITTGDDEQPKSLEEEAAAEEGPSDEEKKNARHVEKEQKKAQEKAKSDE